MTQTSGNIWVFWPQLLYSLPIILVTITAVVVCLMNWQKAPTASMFCLIGFGLIGFNSIFGAVITVLMVRNNGGTGMVREFWSLVTALRIILSVAGYAFLLIAVFSGRRVGSNPSLFESSQPPNPQ